MARHRLTLPPPQLDNTRKRVIMDKINPGAQECIVCPVGDHERRVEAVGFLLWGPAHVRNCAGVRLTSVDWMTLTVCND
jgi:hypothetical protein